MIRRWFISGFLVVFFGMAVFWPMHFYDGRGVYLVPLWQFYLREMSQAMNSSGALGPTSGNATVAIGVLLTHLLISSLAGAAAVGTAWIIKRRQTKKPSAGIPESSVKS